MFYLSIKKVARNNCKITAQSCCCQYVVKFSKEFSSTQCLNFLKRIIFSVHTNVDFIHLTHAKASYYPLLLYNVAIINSINHIDWDFFFFFNKNVHQQINKLNKALMNIFSNFIRNKYVTFNDKDPPWMTNYVKYKIHFKKCLYLKYLKHAKRNCDYI